jgi:hypothetical protein
MGFFEIQGQQGFPRFDAVVSGSGGQNHESGEIGTTARALSGSSEFSPADRAAPRFNYLHH